MYYYQNLRRLRITASYLTTSEVELQLAHAAKLLRFTGLALVLAVLAVGPFFRGLFFWTELLAAIAAVAAGFGLWLAGRGLGAAGRSSGTIPGGWTTLALVALLALYLLQFPWAVYGRGNLDAVLRVLAAIFAYVMLRAEAGPGLRRWLGWAFALSAAAIGLFGFLEFSGYLLKDPDLAQMLSVVGLNTRMFTTFQYPNTAAAYFLAAMLAAAGLGLDDLKPWKLSAVGGLMTFLLLSFFFTISRGALVVLPFGLLFFFAGLDNRRRWAGLLLLVAAAAPMIIALKPVGVFADARNYVSAFKWIAAATAGGMATSLALAFFLQLKGKLQAGIAGAALVLAVAAILVLRPAGGLLPKQASRLFDINFKTVNVVMRLIYDEDALKMAADRPLGRGGWGWDRGYRQYQTFNYTARETHDHYAQTAVEVGWAGLAVLLAALGTALWSAWMHRRDNPLGWTLAAGAGLIAAHSAIDFNLSFGVMWLLLWSLLGAAGGPTATPATAPRWRRAITIGAGTTAALTAALALVLFAGSRWTDQATALTDLAATQAGAQAEATRAAAQTAARQALRYDPWHSEPLLLIGDRESLERAAKLDPYHSGIRFQLAIARELAKEYEGALTEAKAALANQPMVSAYYSKVASLEGTLLNGALHDGRQDDVARHKESLLALGADFLRRKATADPLKHLWKTGAKLEMSPEFKLRYGQALFLSGDAAGAEPLLKDAAKVGLLGSEAELWLYVIAEKRGDSATMKALEAKPWIRFRNANPIYKLLRNI
ncbi:MAG: O-antigen biosynthesis-related protein [Symbiobacteriaceae bacterium]|jgi:hypothetical protein|nr:O-antigen biosynthesis-related protein [Symbiobacteriaceae bacterium]